MQTLNGMYEIPVGEEIKWSDLWEKLRNRPRTPAIAAITEDRLKGYYRKVFECASQKDSLQYIFTITNVYEQYCLLEERHVYKFHLQEAFQRVQMDLRPRNEFAVFIMDELNAETIKQIKAVCHEFTVNGDFIRNYENVYHSILTESSNQSAGIQLADYAVGALCTVTCDDPSLHRTITPLRQTCIMTTFTGNCGIILRLQYQELRGITTKS